MEHTNQHTPTPWIVTNGTDIFTELGCINASGITADKNDGWQIADCSVGLTSVDGVFATMDYREQLANARRICAAVNACEGIETERLEDGGRLIFDLRDKARFFEDVFQRNKEIEAFKAQNARLLEALNLIVGTIEAHEVLSESCDRDGNAYCDCVTKNIEIARAAIAKAETNEPALKPYEPDTTKMTAKDIQEFMTEMDYTRQIGFLQNSIRQFIGTSQFAMRLLSQNEGDALAQSCVTQLAQAINAVTTYGTSPMIQERPRPEQDTEPDSPDPCDLAREFQDGLYGADAPTPYDP